MKTSKPMRDFEIRTWSRCALAALASASLALTACGTGDTTVPGDQPPEDPFPPVEEPEEPSVEEPTEPEDPVEPTETTEEPTEPPVNGEQPTWDNVPTIEDLPGLEAGSWTMLDEYEGWTDGATLTPCQDGTIDAETVLIREFATDDGGWTMIGITMGFTSAEEATAAREEVIDFYVTCPERGSDDHEDAEMWIEPGEIPMSGELADAVGDRDPVALTGTTVTLSNDDAEMGLITSGTLVQVEDRLTWLISQHEGMDHNCGLEDDDELVVQCPEFFVSGNVGLRLID